MNEYSVLMFANIMAFVFAAIDHSKSFDGTISVGDDHVLFCYDFVFIFFEIIPEINSPFSLFSLFKISFTAWILVERFSSALVLYSYSMVLFDQISIIYNWYSLLAFAIIMAFDQFLYSPFLIIWNWSKCMITVGDIFFCNDFVTFIFIFFDFIQSILHSLCWAFAFMGSPVLII